MIGIPTGFWNLVVYKFSELSWEWLWIRAIATLPIDLTGNIIPGGILGFTVSLKKYPRFAHF